MTEWVKKRAIKIGRFVIKNKQTIRKTAEKFGVSKSVVHSDLNYMLPKINISMYIKVKEILKNNFTSKHIRGGLSLKTKLKEAKNVVNL